MASSVEAVLVPTLLIFVGVVLKRFNIIKKEDSTTLNSIVINVALPCLVFTNLSSANITGQQATLPIISFLFCVVCMVIGYIYSKVRHYSKVKTWTIIIATSMMNTGFMGFPVVLGAFGSEGFSIAIFYDLALAILLVVMGIVLSGVFGGNRKDVIKNAVTFMPLWAVVFGLLFNYLDINLGYVVDTTLDYLANATIPLIMISLGLTIDFRSLGKNLSDSGFVIIFRLLVSPILMCIIMLSLGYSSFISSVAIVESAMPIAMNGLVLSLRYDLDSNLMASMVFTSTVLSIITLPVIIYLL
ncbi:MAG: AEC family transporter [Methanosphaera sp.]|nr:AEC family transporter [Methanosphaera sp.]